MCIARLGLTRHERRSRRNTGIVFNSAVAVFINGLLINLQFRHAI
ncbi:hypothetical protein EIO_1277 [Ketogulonicigenium vulgare Y25]|uniref:Uncharacterized protein n=1 Tax=Ketogulonicigenium vulgare (strain WSH-001) TaxID=759362 RepID=F9Y4R2_KETVW|nr:hypothetical protein EIO_1277 [Ketogulonicigenium vulgare Y25]AEM40619.1 hypothetical protein KVU_0780 [Ketogulonicigenium vulgare WSH-001]ALJ80792.1 hypothetical protein KVH_06140 [Ketogulonicigenium vulgare]ANW34993.1 hypothetical protein KvSKV_06110 [Ketogulonicigenium vulgare]AOZ54331.1 hypothetical protein KVC_1314 [Ketogulonicigenium vulgare]